MPQSKRICNCQCCFGVSYKYVCVSTISEHYKKYGKAIIRSDDHRTSDTSDSDLDCEPPSSPVIYPDDASTTRSVIDYDTDNASSSSNHDADDSDNASDAFGFPCLQRSPQEVVIEPGASGVDQSCPHHDSPLDMQSDSDSDSTNSNYTDNDMDEDMEDEDNQTTQWNFSYSKKIYASGIATEILSDSSTYTILQALALNLSVFVGHPSMSKSAFSDYLKLQRQLHQTNKLPTTYSDARKMVSPFLTPKRVFDACVNDCILYRNDTQSLDSCPTCGQPRYKTLKTKHLVARKRFIYIPIGPRLARYYGEENLAKLLHEHSSLPFFDEEHDSEEMIWDLHQSEEWKRLMSGDLKDGGLALSLELDGVNPFHNIGVIYSMTPIMMTILNLPRPIRNVFQHILLIGIIPGTGRSEATTVDPYVDVLVDEMLHLTGSKVIDEYLHAPIVIKLKLLLYILDYPGLSKLFGQMGSGSLQGCHWCWIEGTYCKHLNKVVYLGNRSYLDVTHPLRNDACSFPVKSAEQFTQPILRTSRQEASHRKAYEHAKNKTQAKMISQATGSKGRYALQRIDDHDRIHNTLPDAMHTIKDVIQNVFNLITGRYANMSKVITAEKANKRFQLETISNQSKAPERKGGSQQCLKRWHSHQSGGKLPKKPKSTSEDQHEAKSFSFTCTDDLTDFEQEENVQPEATARSKPPFQLTNDDMKLADQRAESVKAPIGFGIKPRRFFSFPGSLKSHEWKQLATHGILKYCLRGTLGEKQRRTLFCLLDCITRLCAECHSSNSLDEDEVELNKVLALLERDFPTSLQNITTHLLHHIIPGIRLYGPVYSTWMYVFERFNSWICQRVLNMRFPEATAIETYLIFDWVNFMYSSGRMPGHASNFHNAMLFDGEETTTKQETSEPIVQMGCVELSMSKTVTLRRREVTKLQCHYDSVNSEPALDVEHVQLDHIARKFHRYVSKPISRKMLSHIYVGAEKESPHLSTVSSVIFKQFSRGSEHTRLDSGGHIKFGRIQHFIEHIHNGESSILAKIQWFKTPTFDAESRLWHMLNETDHNWSYADPKCLSPPLVIAVEKCEDSDRIWILDSNQIKFSE